MDLVSGAVGLVSGNENSASNEDGYVECLLNRISNGKLAEERRSAMTEAQSVVAESSAAQLVFGAMGFPVIMAVLKEECNDVEMARGALETLVGALTPIEYAKGSKNEVQPALMNTDLLSREADSISLLLSLLSGGFYVRYYTLQLLTALLTNSTNRLQEAILTIPRGITRLMDMLMDHEVIRNEALLLLTHLTREAEEIQKIVDSLELLNNLFRNNASNQGNYGILPLLSILKLQGSTYSFTQQKTIILLSALGTIDLLMVVGPEADPRKYANMLTNKTTLNYCFGAIIHYMLCIVYRKKTLNHLLMLSVESQWAIHCLALRCIGDLIAGHPKNIAILASKVLGEEPQVEPAMNSILRILLRMSSMQEFVAADYVFKNFCEKNADGQTMLAFTLIPQPHSMTHAPLEEDVNMSFGSMLLRGLTVSEKDGDLEACCRAASDLSHILKDNIQGKERVLCIELEAPMPSIGASEPLMHQMVKCMVIDSSMKSKDGISITSGNLYVQSIILKLLVTCLAECPSAVHCFLDSRPHLTYLLELVSNSSATVCTGGLAECLLGECVIYNKSIDKGKDACTFDEMQKSFLFTSANMAEIEDVDERDLSDQKDEDHPILSAIFYAQFANLVKSLEADIRESVVEVYSHPKSKVAEVPAELEQRSGESDGEYIKRLKAFVEKQCSEIQDLLSRNALLAEDLTKAGGGGYSQPEQRASGAYPSPASQRLEMLKAEKANIESEAYMYQNLAGKMESDLKSLSDAYDSLEQANFHLEKEVRAMKIGEPSTFPDVEAIRAEAREEAQRRVRQN
ncbi:hypothetical protein I3842_03G040100 [Carya illinoinensis]|uniref:Golgin candidate 6 n=1 Tax=Carya illinoinensis TaxID=32201 RepID=A0A922FGX7_CARIL|nr:hypothetical protein I3842_03G040100 [Carya illinoinensis]